MTESMPLHRHFSGTHHCSAPHERRPLVTFISRVTLRSAPWLVPASAEGHPGHDQLPPNLTLLKKKFEAMGSVDAEVEIDMEISDDEQESLKGRAVAGYVVDGGGVVKHNSPAGATTTDKADSSRKRKRTSPEKSSPSVRVEYHNLSRESRRKLQELLRDWSLWQAYHSRHSSSESRDNVVESGEEQYYPALQVGPVGSSFSVSFWVDKPAKQGRRKESGDSRGLVRTPSQDLRDSEVDVPLYDRVTPSLSTQESRKDGCVELEREATRCFNCGSYSHGLRDCQRQLNYDAINSARSSHASKRSFSSGPRSSTRYYETHPDNEEPDRAPWQLHQTPPCNPGTEVSRSSSSSEKKEEKDMMPPSADDNEEGEIVDGVGSSCAEEELYIAFSPDPIPQTDRTISDYIGARVPYNSVPERMWRSPPAAFSPPIQMHPNFHHQRSFAYTTQNPAYSHTPSPLHHGGMNSHRSWEERHPQRSWDGRNVYYPENISTPALNGSTAPIAVPVSKKEDERHPQRSWDGRSLYYPENNSSPAMNGSSAPVSAAPVSKKEEDDWELNFESSVYQSESSRSFGVPGVAEHYTPSVRYPALTVNTVSGFTPPDPSQLSPTGSGYGDSFRPSPVPQTSVQYHISYLSPQVSEPSYSAEAWDKAQAALSSLQSDEKGVGC